MQEVNNTNAGKLAKCPVCREKPMVFHYGEQTVSFAHCGVRCDSVEIWNRYAAAMEFAKGCNCKSI